MDNLARLKQFLNTLVQGAQAFARVAVVLYQKVWFWLHTHVPILGALVRRHITNPTTVIIDAAIIVLTVYSIFGLVGYSQIYPQKAETRLAENISSLYPFPAAKIDATLVWSHSFLTRLRFLNTFSASAPSDTASKPPTDSELRQRVLEGLIEDRIIYLEAQKRHIRVTSEELNTAVSKQGKSEEIGPKIQQLYGMTLPEFRKILAEQILKEKVKNAVLTRWRIRHILTLDLASAQEAKRQLNSGKDFTEVVKEFSQDAKTTETGGELGFWRKGELASQVSQGFEDVVATLAVNQISDPIQTKFGYQIVQLIEKTDSTSQVYEEWYKEALAGHKVKRFIKI
ncbi:MAG: peptidylprolyl isomerase [Patescibacteria group bacterium]